jgi:hypothetical protein
MRAFRLRENVKLAFFSKLTYYYTFSSYKISISHEKFRQNTLIISNIVFRNQLAERRQKLLDYIRFVPSYLVNFLLGGTGENQQISLPPSQNGRL